MFGFDMFGMDGNNIMNSMNVCPGCGRMLLPGEFSAGGLCQECFESVGEEEDVREDDYASSTQNNRYCRFCRQLLPEYSRKCIYCGRFQ